MHHQTFRRVSTVVLIAALAFAGGFVWGGARGAGWWWIERLQTEVAGNLSYRVETLARLRTGDQEGAVELLEMSVDQAMLTLTQGEDWQRLPRPVQQSMMLGKAYRSAYPGAEEQPELTRILARVSLPEADYCSPALQQILGIEAGSEVESARPS